MPATDEIPLYERLAQLHDRMLKAASALAWDELAALESQSAQIVDALAKLPPTVLSVAAKDRKRILIQGIMEKQGKIREEVAVWRSDVEPFLHTLAGR